MKRVAAYFGRALLSREANGQSQKLFRFCRKVRKHRYISTDPNRTVLINHIALRKVKIIYYFGLSECKRVKTSSYNKHIIIFQTVTIAAELRKPVYWSVSSRVINYDIILQYMASVKWDVKDIMSQHNSYIDAILKVSL